MMPKITDIETILDDILEVLQNNLNNTIDAINTEKADAIVLDHIDNNAYSLQTLNDRPMAYNPFILYGLDDPGAQGIGPATLKRYRINVIICLSDNGQDLQIARRVFRYSRALEQVIESYFAGIPRGFRMTVESLAPIQFTQLNSSNEYRAVGASILVGIA